MDRFSLPDAIVFLDDQVSLVTSYLSTVITLLTCFDSLHTSTSSDDLISHSVDNDVQVWLPTFFVLDTYGSLYTI
jgi:hypothetical protein